MSVHERADRAAQIQSQVTYHGQRLELYRRLHGAKPSERLRTLESAYIGAQERLADCTVDPAPDERGAKSPPRAG